MPQYSQTTLSQQSALATVTSLLLSRSPAIPSVCSAAQQPNLISTVATIRHIADQLWSTRYLADRRVQQKDRASDNILSLLDKFCQNDRQASTGWSECGWKHLIASLSGSEITRSSRPTPEAQISSLLSSSTEWDNMEMVPASEMLLIYLA